MNDPRHDRLLELLADRALVGLDGPEEAELAMLLRYFPNEDVEAFDRAAAAAMLVHLGKTEPMPQHLAARIEAQTPKNRPIQSVRDAPSSMRSIAPTPIRSRSTTFVTAAGWIAAAACFALAAFGWFGRPEKIKIVEVAAISSNVAPSASAPTAKPTLADLRTALAADPSVAKIPWSATKDPGAAGASGDVVFSVDKQTGFMRFHGLAANDPKQHQYQLWIFDKAQDAKYPIDGGVFDVVAQNTDASGDTIVQIQPKIRVTDPTLFAVTIEHPGGVVVSKREHIVVTAARS